MKFHPIVAALVSLLFFSVGCTTHKVNWASRVGNYTYDQSISEFGPPDKMAMLSDESKVAEWATYRGSGMSVGLGTGIGPVGAGIGVPLGGNRVRTMRLTFGPDGVLQSWSK